MGGDITVESRLGEGSAFTVHLPADITDTRRGQSRQGLPASSGLEIVVNRQNADGSVLVIDDDPVACDLLSRVLAREGFRVVPCTDATERILPARRCKPMAITLDVFMAGMDGWEALSALKADPDLADIPVIIVSIEDDKSRACSLGVSDCLTKPLDPDRLIQVLNKYRNGNKGDPILVVEDDENNREILRRMLGAAGWEIREAENGRVALESLEQQRPAGTGLEQLALELGNAVRGSGRPQLGTATSAAPDKELWSTDQNPRNRHYSRGSYCTASFPKYP
jgi:CheY-like chemotaxis protein